MPTEHQVEQGDTFASIALHYGFPDWRTIYNYPENSSLKRNRASPFILHPGDVVVVPDRAAKTVSVPTDARHQFIRKSIGLRLRLELKDRAGEALANAPYQLTVEGNAYSGNTDDNGVLEREIPADAQTAVLRLPGERGSSSLDREYELRIGHLDPLETPSGAQARLRNLGYACGDPQSEWNDQTREALRAFQRAQGLRETGELDESTKGRLRDQHKC